MEQPDKPNWAAWLSVDMDPQVSRLSLCRQLNDILERRGCEPYSKRANGLTMTFNPETPELDDLLADLGECAVRHNFTFRIDKHFPSFVLFQATPTRNRSVDHGQR